MLLAFEGHQVPIDDNYLNEYRRVTGMDVGVTYIPYIADNEGVDYKKLNVNELSALIYKGMKIEMDIAKGL